MNVYYKHHQQDALQVPRADSSVAAKRVSVLINNFNYGHFVQDAITSALAQTHHTVEVIVVDDGSTDHSLEVIQALQLLHPELQLISKANGGQASAMNAGYAACTGDFIIFLDSDDMLDPTAIAECLGSVGEDTAFVQFFLRTVDRQGMITGLHPFCHFVEGGEVFRQVLTSGNFRFMPTSGNLFTRQALTSAFPIAEQNWKICADAFLVAAAAASGRVVILPQILGSYRTHGANAWYEDEESPERLRQIARNHNRLWFDLFSVVDATFEREEARYASLSLIRRIAVGACLAPTGSFSALDLKRCRRTLRSILGRLSVPQGERLLHWLMITTIGARNGHHRLARLLGYRDPSSVPGRLCARMMSARRHDWLEATADPARIAVLAPGDLLEFGQRGNATDYLWYGFGSTENWANWSSAECSGIIFKVPDTTSSLDLKLDLTPCLAPPVVVAQPIAIEANGECLWEGNLSAREAIDLKLSRRLIALDKDRIVRLHIRAAGAFVPSLLNQSSGINRIVAFGIHTLRAVKTTPELVSVPHALPCRILPTDVGAHAIFHSGWDLNQGVARQTNLRSQIRFSLPNPIMDRFAIVFDFERPAAQALGDWRVRVSGEGFGSDTIDLRQSGQLMLKVPRGKAPRSGVINLMVESSNFLPVSTAGMGKSGNRLTSIRVLDYKATDLNLSIKRENLTIDFTDRGNGRAYLRSGWHAPDASGTWASAPRSIVAGMVFNQDSEIFLTLGLASLMRGAHIGQQNVVVEVNGVRIAAQSVEGQGEILAVVPRGTIGPDYLLQIAICSSAVGSPSELGPYAEQRAVGICLKRLKIESLILNPVAAALTGLPASPATLTRSSTISVLQRGS